VWLVSKLFIEQKVREGYNANELRATSHMRPRARDHYTPSTLIGGKGGVGPSSLHTTLEKPTEYMNARFEEPMKYMNARLTIYMDSYMALNGSCFVVIWIIFKNHLLEVDLTQNRETTGTLNAHNRWLIPVYRV
jgi:hypothetical protein